VVGGRWSVAGGRWAANPIADDAGSTHMWTLGRIIGVSACVVAVCAVIATHHSGGTLQYTDARQGRETEFTLRRGHVRFAYCVYEPSESHADSEPFVVLRMQEPESFGRSLKETNLIYRGEYQESEFPVWPVVGILLILTAMSFRRRSGPVVPRDPSAAWQTVRILSAVAACGIIALGIRSVFRSPQIAWIDGPTGRQYGLTAIDGGMSFVIEVLTDEYFELSKSIESRATPYVELTDQPSHPDGGLADVNWRPATWFHYEESDTVAMHAYEVLFPLWIPAVLLLLPLRPWAVAATVFRRTAKLCTIRKARSET